MNVIASIKYVIPSLMAACPFLSSCVHEWPDPAPQVNVELLIRHQLPWTEFYFNPDITRAADDWQSRYVLNVYRAGETTGPVMTRTFYRGGNDMSDFSTSLSLPPGVWDIYTWQDFVENDMTPFFDVSDFGAITYIKPYRGDVDKRDAFEGRLTVSVPTTVEETASVSGTIDLERPVAKYVFIATDFERFYNESVLRSPAVNDTRAWTSLTPEEQNNALKGWSVTVRYPLYMQAVYNEFTQKVTDSWTGISYQAKITPKGSGRAVIGFDYVFMNHVTSGTQVQLSLNSPDGQSFNLTGTLSIPLKRNQITFIEGDFLTATAGDGINIDFSFGGDINIKI